MFKHTCHYQFYASDKDFVKLYFVFIIDPQGCQDTKLQAERISALQERKQVLEALLSSRVGELRQVCLLEAVSCSFSLMGLWEEYYFSIYKVLLLENVYFM